LAAKLKTESAKTMVENFKKLDANRIDWFVSSNYMGLAWLAQTKTANKIVALKPAVSSNFIHTSFSKKSPQLSRFTGPAMDVFTK
jgi:polar amino acid transport system substrate-binding protein